MAKTLLLGASGQLGSALARRLDDAVTPGRADLDLATLTHQKARGLIASTRPGVIINCAAWTAVDAAEDHEDEATRINGAAVGILAGVSSEAGIPFVTYSTDYVFDGRGTSPYSEDAPPSPINAYGRSKLAGEQAALQFPGTLVIRTSWVQSATHRCFIRIMMDLAGQREELRVVDDQRGRPTFAADLAQATLEALDAEAKGLLHVANTGETTWYGLATETLQIAGLDTSVVPIHTSAFPTAAERPAYSVLDTSRMATVGINPLPTWRKSLREAVHRIEQAGQR